MKRIIDNIFPLFLAIISMVTFATEKLSPADNPYTIPPTEGQLIVLKTSSASFNGIFKLPAAAKPRGGFLLLPDANGRADQSGLISTLRSRLTEAKWATLAIELPPMDLSAKEADIVKNQKEIQMRLEQGLSHFKENKINPVIIIAYGTSAPATLQWLSEQKADPASALVLISANIPVEKSVDKKATQTTSSPSYTKIRMPILDIVAAEDYQQILQASKIRATQFEQSNKNNYQYYLVNGTDHAYMYLGGLLQNKMNGWLKQNKVVN